MCGSNRVRGDVVVVAAARTASVSDRTVNTLTSSLLLLLLSFPGSSIGNESSDCDTGNRAMKLVRSIKDKRRALSREIQRTRIDTQPIALPDDEDDAGSE